MTPPTLFKISYKALFLTSAALLVKIHHISSCLVDWKSFSIILNKILRHGTMWSVALGFFFPVHGWKQDGFEKFDMTNSFLSFLFCNLNVRICCWKTTTTCFSLVRLFHSSFHFFFFLSSCSFGISGYLTLWNKWIGSQIMKKNQGFIPFKYW